MKSALLAALLALTNLLVASAIRADEPDRPQPPPTPQSPAFQSADDACRTAKQKAAEAYAASLKEAQDEYVRKLDATLKEVMQKGDLDEANRINAWKKWTVNQFAHPSDPVVIMPSTSGVVYLSDMEAFDVSAFNGVFGKKGVFQGNLKTVVKGKYSPNGIGIHCNYSGTATVRFDLNRAFSQFRSQVAVNDEASSGSRTAITFSVLGDGKDAVLRIPVGVAHGYRPLTTPCSLFYIVTKTFDLADPDEYRVPFDHPAIHHLWEIPNL